MTGDDPKTWAKQFFRFCLLILVGVVLLWLALQLLAQFWGWILLAAAIVAAAWITITVIRFRRNRW